MAKIVDNKLGFLEDEQATKLAIDTLREKLKKYNLTFEEDKENKCFYIRGKKGDLLSYIAFNKNIDSMREIAYLITDEGEYL